MSRVRETTESGTPRFACMRLILATLVGAFFIPGAWGATYNAASCSRTDVGNAVSQATHGDTVQIPAGDCTWTSRLVITQGIYLKGAGQNQTTIRDNITKDGSDGSRLIQATVNSPNNFRMSDIRFVGQATNPNNWNAGHIWIEGTQTAFRLHNFTVESPQTTFIWTSGAALGLIDNCTLTGNRALLAASLPSWGGSSYGDGSWAEQIYWGSDKAVYVEDCTLTAGGSSNLQFAFDTYSGARLVIRHNTITRMFVAAHGTDTGQRMRGERYKEVYNNTVVYDSDTYPDYFVYFRSGTGVVFGNTITNPRGMNSVLKMTNCRDPEVTGCGGPSFPPWGACNGSSPYDGNFQTGGGYRCVDQPGAGTSRHLNGLATPTTAWVQNILDPAYVWGNTLTGSTTFGVVAGSSNVQNNRDYYIGTARPGYTPYTYPHPLRSAGGAPPADTTAPTAPSSLSAGSISSTQINLSWTASTDNVGVSGYRVERCQGSNCTGFVQIAAPTTVSYSDTGLAGGTTYRYRVRATDAVGNLSSYSNIAGATTATAADTTPPSAPSNLSALAPSASQINLVWTASTDNVGVAGYNVERCQGGTCTSFLQIATTTVASYADSGLTPSTAYRYRVRARDAAGNNSVYSNIASATTQAVQSTAPPPLPQGNTGIAASYPLDASIESHPEVLLADGFESYSSVSNLTSKWNQVYQGQFTRIATEPQNVFSGSRALEFRVPQQSAEVSNELVKNISPTEDVLFVRAYTKFEAGYNVNGSSHDGISISSNYSNPGVPANGTNKFFVDVENSRMSSGETTPGLTHFYIYHPEQRTEWGDHWYPDGRVLPFDSVPGDFGPHFIARPSFTPNLDRWYCYELMVKANTPGQKDGRIALWIDGVLIADYPNVRLRDASTLKIDTVKLSLHIYSNTLRQNLKWYDNVVIARSYIGPMTAADAPAPPSGLQTSIQ